LFAESDIGNSRGQKNELCFLKARLSHIGRGDFRLGTSLGQNSGVTTFEAAAFQNAQRLVSPTIRSGESFPECTYETENARVSAGTVLATILNAPELESGNPRAQGLKLRSIKFIHQLLAVQRGFRSVNNLEAHLAGG